MQVDDYSDYTVTVRRDCSYYGGDVSREEAALIADRIEDALAREYPGIYVRRCSMIGHNPQDETQGPDEAVIRLIDTTAEQVRLGGAQ